MLLWPVVMVSLNCFGKNEEFPPADSLSASEDEHDLFRVLLRIWFDLRSRMGWSLPKSSQIGTSQAGMREKDVRHGLRGKYSSHQLPAASQKKLERARITSGAVGDHVEWHFGFVSATRKWEWDRKSGELGGLEQGHGTESRHPLSGMMDFFDNLREQ
jgi:hypothetical protein